MTIKIRDLALDAIDTWLAAGPDRSVSLRIDRTLSVQLIEMVGKKAVSGVGIGPLAESAEVIARAIEECAVSVSRREVEDQVRAEVERRMGARDA